MLYRHVRRWKENEQIDPQLKQQLHALSDEQLEDAFYRHLDFGTAGMRGKTGPGTNRMNIYTVRRAVEGLARYLDRQGADAKARGIVIAYDSRRFSSVFAEEAAVVLANHQIHVHLFPSLRPTPVLSFAVRQLNAWGGIMITASHNPPEYNGLKLYGADGAQLSPQNIEGIAHEISLIEDELAIPAGSINDPKNANLIHMIPSDVDEAYLREIGSLSLQTDHRAKRELCLVYTPLHGTGRIPVQQALANMGYTNVHVVFEQAEPDPDFSTVAIPNPEDPKAFALGLKVAEQVNADLILATDPDADRLGIWAKDAGGHYAPLNGNQIGALLLDYLLGQKEKNGQLPRNGAVVKSLVTSDLGKAIADAYGVKTFNTLTGFKYIAEKIKDFEQDGSYEFLFGYEESYGYLIGSFVRDKDAVQAAVLCAEMAAFYKQNNQTLFDVLEGLYQTHGYYQETLHSYQFEGKAGQEMMDAILSKLRKTDIAEIAGTPIAVRKDYLNGVDDLPPANVLRWELQDGSWIVIRPSGTEPKMKVYYSVNDRSKEKASRKLTQYVHAFQQLIDSLK